MKLKPCPFCGEEMNAEFDIGIKYWGILPEKLYYIHCGCCGGRAGIRDTKQEAVESWNRRIE
jgi:Lar family restriction alleviation protein